MSGRSIVRRSPTDYGVSVSQTLPSRVCRAKENNDKFLDYLSINTKYEGWNFNSGNYLFTTDTK